MKKTMLLAFLASSLFALTAVAQDDGYEESAGLSASTSDGTKSDKSSGDGLLANLPNEKGHLHIFASLGYALPVIDLNHTSGALPIRMGAHYFVIDRLGVGLKMVFSPALGMSPASMLIFNFQAEALYLFDFGLDVYASLGVTSFTTKVSIPFGGDVKATSGAFGMALGTSYNLFFNEKFGLQAGFEFDFNFNSGGAMIYPLFFVGGKFSLGPFGA
ncbi:MAG: hypothetical protein M0R76_00630 [Proteobacteria bacterium]|nr:hypothetical protein [Pseudomonadota bacterium]